MMSTAKEMWSISFHLKLLPQFRLLWITFKSTCHRPIVSYEHMTWQCALFTVSSGMLCFQHRIFSIMLIYDYDADGNDDLIHGYGMLHVLEIVKT